MVPTFTVVPPINQQTKLQSLPGKVIWSYHPLHSAKGKAINLSSIDLQKDEVFVDGRTYHVQVRHTNDQPIQAPRLVVVAYQPNQLAQELLKVCINTIQRFTPEKHEL